jgi:hypothetical protein
MRLILAGNYRIYTEFCKTHELVHFKEAKFISQAQQLHGSESELIVTCMAKAQREYYDIIELAETRNMSIIHMPCQPFCMGEWDKLTLNEK